MKNSFLRLVSVALLSAVTGMVFAGTNPKFQNSAGSNQRSVKTGWHSERQSIEMVVIDYESTIKPASMCA